MSELLNKVSSYNIFNYLLPGALFAFIGEQVSIYQLTPEDSITSAFAFYFYGLIISRIGSLLVQPILKCLGILKFTDYASYVKASKSDPKLNVLSEQNNTYRSLSSLVVCIFGLKVYELLLSVCPSLQKPAPYILLLSLLVLLVFSYRKQTKYIVDRISVSEDD